MQIDFILFRRTMHKLVTDVKVIPGEEVALQHQLLVCNMGIDVPPKSKCKFTPPLKVWKLKDPQTSNHFQEVINSHVSAGVADATTEDIWNNIKTGLLKTTEEVCGTAWPHLWHQETWWWNEHVEKAIAAKRKAFKACKAEHNRYNLCCQAAARVVSSCQQETLHSFRRPGEGVWSSALVGQLVGTEKTWCGGVDCATGAGDVCQCAEACPFWGGVQWSIWSEGRYSPRLGTQLAALHHCAWSLVMRVPLWGPLGGPLCWWPCYHRWIALGMCQEALNLERSNGGERTENAGKSKIMICVRAWTSCSVQTSSICHLLHWSGQQHLLQWLQVQEMQWAQALDKGPWLQMYTVPGNCTPLGWQREVGPDKLEVVASFCYLGDMLSAAGGCELSTTTHVKTTWKKFKELLPVFSSCHLFQDTWLHVQLLFVERNAPCQWDLAIDKAKPPKSAAKWQGNDQTGLQCQAARHCHH